jgi:predicted ester cyclase
MTAHQSPSCVMRAMVEMFDTGDVEGVASIVSSEYVDHQGIGTGDIIGVEGFCQVVRIARGGLVSLDVVIEDLIAGDDRVAARLLWQGTRTNGEQEQRETIDIVRVADVLAIEHWGCRLA